MLKHITEPSHHYAIRLHGVELVRGNANSLADVFNNLEGRNFEPRGINKQTPEQWLASMSSELKTPLSFGQRIVMATLADHVIRESIVGKFITSGDLHNLEHALRHDRKMSNFEFEYQLLARLKQDCEYFLGAGSRNKKRLWAQDESLQIQKMKELYDLLPEKPEWITLDAICSYEQTMLNPQAQEDPGCHRG